MIIINVAGYWLLELYSKEATFENNPVSNLQLVTSI
jgi:hypothetical protein